MHEDYDELCDLCGMAIGDCECDDECPFCGVYLDDCTCLDMDLEEE